MVVPCSLVIIKPMSVGRGDGPGILANLLNYKDISLVRFHAVPILEKNWERLAAPKGPHKVDLDPLIEVKHSLSPHPAWVCLFTSNDRETDPYDKLIELCGERNPVTWKSSDLRYIFSGLTERSSRSTHPCDTVFHISPSSRALFDLSILAGPVEEEFL